MTPAELKILTDELERLKLKNKGDVSHRALTLAKTALEAKYCDCGRERYSRCGVCDDDRRYT